MFIYVYIAQADRHWHYTTEVQIQSQVTSYEIYGG
jgi:hypothetical protein